MKKLKRKNLIIIVLAVIIATFLGIVILEIYKYNLELEQQYSKVIVEKATASRKKESKDKIASADIKYKNRENQEACFEDLCFVQGTQVITPDGYVSIENLKVGDYVYSRNEETNQIETKKVLQTFESDYKSDTLKIYTKDSSVEATLNHKFYEKNKEWIEAEKLEVGNILINNSNEELEIVKIDRVKSIGTIKVYNLEVEDNHNYFVGFDCVLVHNCCVDRNSLIQIDLFGNTKPIAQIQKGDRVLTYNSKTGKNELREVTKITIKK
ncbi:MAG: hypothetical protein HFJ45_04350 [Clostridia bacterium]|nr:hypothetical protein [Clostridia bacterium]